jgi:hypothetical protein
MLTAELLFTEFFGRRQCPLGLMPCNPQTPLSSAVNKIEHERDQRANNENPCEQNQRRQHFLNKVDLQSDKRSDRDQKPFAGFSVAPHLTDFHWMAPFFRSSN